MSSGVGSIRNTLDPEFPYHGYDALEYKASKAAMNMIMAIYAVKNKDEPFKFNACCSGLRATGLNGGKGSDPSVGTIIDSGLATAGGRMERIGRTQTRTVSVLGRKEEHEM